MEGEAYSIITTGAVLDGFDRQTVIEKLAALFKCPVAKAEQILGGRRVRLKQGLDKTRALNYHKALRAAGVDIVIEPRILPKVAPSSRPTTTAPQSDQPVATASNSGLSLVLAPGPAASQDGNAPAPAVTATPGANMLCPKCRALQPKAATCRECGEPIVDVPTAAIRTNDEADEDNLTQDWSDFVGPNFDSVYQTRFAEMAQNNGRYALNWHWAAFLIPVPWLIYRKLYLWAALILLVNALAPFKFALQLSMAVALGLSAHYLYYRHTTKRIAATNIRGEARRHALTVAGGTNNKWAVSGIVVVIGMVMGAVLSSKMSLPTEQIVAQIQKDQQAMAAAPDEQTFQQLAVLRMIVTLGLTANGITAHTTDGPQDTAELIDTLKLKSTMFEDRWGNEIRFAPADGGYSLTSSGADGEFDTDDDVTLTYELPG